MWPLGLLPAWLTRRRVVEPMRRHTAGTLLVSNDLLQRGTLVWSFCMQHAAPCCRQVLWLLRGAGRSTLGEACIMPASTMVRLHEVLALSCRSEAGWCLQGKAGACMMI